MATTPNMIDSLSAPTIASETATIPAQYTTIGVYLRNFSTTNANSIIQSGRSIVSIYEKNQTFDDPSYFTVTQADTDAATAIEEAVALGQPLGSDIYFAVDDEDSILSANDKANIDAYFKEIQKDFHDSLFVDFFSIGQLTTADPYTIGVYAGGNVLKSVQSLGLSNVVDYWFDSHLGGTFSSPQITRNANDISISGVTVTVDTDTTSGSDFGQWSHLSLIEPKSTLPVSIGGTATISHSFLWSYDIDNTTGAYGNPAAVTYTVTAPAHGTLLLNGAATTTFTQADIDNGLVQYRENGDAATSDGFTFTVSDPAGNQITDPYTIAIVNTTAPVIDANATFSASIGGSAMIYTDSLCTVALGDEPAELRYTVLAGPVHGMLLVNGTPATSFTQADIDDGLLLYGENGEAASSDSFTFQATDAAGDQTPVTTFNIAIAGGTPGPGTADQTPASGSTTQAISPAVPLFDFSDISFGANTRCGYAANGDNTGGTLSVGDGVHTASLALLGQYAAAGFATAPDPGGGAVVTYMAAQGGSGAPTLLSIPQH